MLEGLAAGSEEAWRAFLAGYGRLIHAAVRRFHLSEPDAEDVFQNACVAIHRSIHTLRNPDKLASWVYGVTYRLAVDHLRRRREIPVEDPDRLAAGGARRESGPAADRRLEELEETALLYDAVSRLDPRCRRLLVGLYLEDPPLSYREVSARDAMPVGSIGPTRARCLDKLRRLIGDEVSIPGPGTTTERNPGTRPEGGER